MTNSVYHVKATPVVGTNTPMDVWIKDGVFSFKPIPHATELQGKFISLGMVDAHVHLSLDFGNSNLPPASADLVLHNAKSHLRSGVTAVRDAGYVQQLALDGVELPPIPEIQRSGWIHVPEGRFFPGVDIGKNTSPGTLVDRVEEVAAYHLPWFKIIADFPGPDGNLFTAPLNYPVEEIKAAVAAAHANGMRVMAHSTGPHVDDLVTAGVDAIEHGMSVTRRTVALMADHNVHWTPTIATAEGFLIGAENEKGAPEMLRQSWGDRLKECLPLCSEFGVPILAGSDELPHGRLLDEMDAMVRHGMTNTEVIAAATTVGRKMLRLGGLEHGDVADLVLLDNDPAQDLTAYNQPTAVLAAGQLVDLESLPDVPGTDIPVRVRLAKDPHSECVFDH